MRWGNQWRDIFSPYIPGFTSVEVILRPPQDCLDARQELQIKNHKHFRALNPKTFSSIKLKTWGNGHVVLTGTERAQGTTKRPPIFKTLWGSMMYCLEHLPKGISLTVNSLLKESRCPTGRQKSCPRLAAVTTWLHNYASVWYKENGPILRSISSRQATRVLAVTLK